MINNLTLCIPTNHFHGTFEMFISRFYSWFGALTIIQGLLGTALSLVLLIRHPGLFPPCSRFWLTAILFFDFLNLLVSNMDLYLYTVVKEQYDDNFLVPYLGRARCGLLYSFFSSFQWSSYFLLAGFSVDRCVAVLFPLQRHVQSSGCKRTVATIAGLLTICFTVSFTFNLFTYVQVPHLNLMKHLPATEEFWCGVSPTQHNSDLTGVSHCERQVGGKRSALATIAHYILDLVFKFLPLTVVLVTTCLILARLLRLPAVSRRTSNSAIARCARPLQAPMMAIISMGRLHRQQASYTRMSILLLIMDLSLLLTMPLYNVFELFDGIKSEGYCFAFLTGNTCVSSILHIVLNHLVYFFNQTNWIFLLAIGTQFRRKFLLLFRPMLTRCRHFMKPSPTTTALTGADADVGRGIEPSFREIARNSSNLQVHFPSKIMLASVESFSSAPSRRLELPEPKETLPRE